MDTMGYLTTCAAALLFAGIFLAGGRIHPLQPLFRDRRGPFSFAAGMSAAYVFVHVMPELHAARQSFTESVALRFEGVGIYFLALVGFLVFYGLDHLVTRLQQDAAAGEEGAAGPAFRVHVGGFAMYVLMVWYLLVRNLEDTRPTLALFTVAMSAHFLGIAHSIRDELGAPYERVGRFVLAGAAVVGWGLGLLFPLPPYVLALLVSFVSGAVIVNSAIMELPSDKDGRFVPFMVGGLLYGLILLPLG